jgi:carbon-monoxide dehydrogenase large subunit
MEENVPVSLALNVNGKPVSAEIDARTLLVDFLRNNLALTGTHVGCDTAQCGACTVHLDGQAVKACNVLALQAHGRAVVTIEGLAAEDGALHPMQAAFRACHGLQCGFCTPGMVMSAIDLVNRHPNADEATIRASSKATSAAAPGITTSSRPCARAPPRWAARETTMGANDSTGIASAIGQPVLRKEDARFLTGTGQFTDDVTMVRQTHAYFLRSPHAHATIRAIDVKKAKAAPGVVGVFTSADLTGVNGLPCGWLITGTDGKPMNEPPHPVLAQGKVRYVGDAVALVVAESIDQAKDAAEQIEVDYDVLASVVSSVDALKPGAPQIHEQAPGNRCYTWALGDKAAVDAAFAKAAHVTKLDLVNNRLVPNAIEPRAALASWNRADDAYTLYVTSQNPHVERLLMTAFVLGLPEHKVRVIAPDVGGGFGSKIYLYPEETAMVWASKRVNRPIKWAAERSESFLSDAHGRDHVTHAELALDKDGKFLALRVQTTANMGAYLSTFASCIPTILYATLLAGQYTTPAIHCEVTAVFTNTAPVDAYRGAGRPEATYVVERIVHQAAVETGIAQDELRRRNFIREFPYQTPVALNYDIGNYDQTLDAANEMADVAGFAARKAEAKQRGKLRGLGYASYIEACGLAPSNIAGALGARAGLFEAGEVRVHPTGSVTVFTGSHSHGQGHETTFAQVVAARLGVPVDNVDVVHGDTGRVPFGMGTYGSRSLSVGGTAIVKALDKIIAKARRSQRTCSRPPSPTSSSTTASSRSQGPTAARRSARSR